MSDNFTGAVISIVVGSVICFFLFSLRSCDKERNNSILKCKENVECIKAVRGI